MVCIHCFKFFLICLIRTIGFKIFSTVSCHLKFQKVKFEESRSKANTATQKLFPTPTLMQMFQLRILIPFLETEPPFQPFSTPCKSDQITSSVPLLDHPRKAPVP